ncbi:MAG: hypothetical protein WCA46_20520 [Actinocatenispora sp.]
MTAGNVQPCCTIDVLMPWLVRSADRPTDDDVADQLWHDSQAAHARVVALLDAHEAQQVVAQRHARHLRRRVAVANRRVLVAQGRVHWARACGQDVGTAQAALGAADAAEGNVMGNALTELRRLARASSERETAIRAAFASADEAADAYELYAGPA